MLQIYFCSWSNSGHSERYPHSIRGEQHHGDFENWVKRKTDSVTDGHFESYIQASNLVRRRAYTAAKRISKATSGGQGMILSALEMDARYASRNSDQAYKDSVGHSLNLAVNEMADVLHTFFLNVVSGL